MKLLSVQPILTITIILISLWFFCSVVSAQQMPQQITIASSPNPVGSGARAVGMGGAFIAIADDATAASWNPAGLSQLKRPEISFALSYLRRREDYDSRFHPETEGVQKSLTRDLNYMSIAYPFELFERNMIVSLNYQRLYDFKRNINIDFLTRSFNPRRHSSTETFQKIDFRQKGALKALSPAYAIEIIPSLSLGITCNIWTDDLFWSNGWESDNTVTGYIAKPGMAPVKFKSRDHDRYYDFSGFNVHVGFLWTLNRYITIGGVVKTPFKADIKHERLIQTSIKAPSGIVSHSLLKIKEDVELEMPLSYGMGIAVRVSDTFTVSFDIYRTEWSHFILEDGKGRRMSPITGKPSHQNHINATNQVRLGAEYLFIFEKTIIPLRCGLFYDPEPSEKSPEDFWGFSVGTGISIGNVILDFAYQFRYGDDVEGEVLNIPQTNADVTQNLFMASAIYHF